ncbi:hypothetical protein J6590_101783, partial [Homalodisca vitripennis]
RGCVGSKESDLNGSRAPGTKEVEVETKTTIVVGSNRARKKSKGSQQLLVGAFQARHALILTWHLFGIA